MDRKTASYIENWNLGRYFTKPFLAIQKDEEEGEIKEDGQIEAKLPELVPLDRILRETGNSAVNLVFLNEIKQFNRLIVILRNIQLKSQVTEELREMAGYIESLNTSDFLNYLNEKRTFLISLPSQEIDVRLFKDIKGLFYSLMSDFALKNSLTVDSVELEFRTSPSDFSSLVLTNFISYGAKVEPLKVFEPSNFTRSDTFQLSQPVNESKPFIRVQKLYANIVQKVQKSQKFFMCPIFRNLPSTEFALKSDLHRTDGDTDNFICYLPLKSNASDKYLIANSACIVCQIPNIFMV